MANLANMRCMACEGGTPPMPLDKAEQMMAQIPGWELQDSTLSRALRFKDFKEAMSFVNQIADLAEDEGHHPDIHISWNRVRLDLTTHAIHGLSDNDFIMAAKINLLSPPTPPK